MKTFVISLLVLVLLFDAIRLCRETWLPEVLRSKTFTGESNNEGKRVRTKFQRYLLIYLGIGVAAMVAAYVIPLTKYGEQSLEQFCAVIGARILLVLIVWWILMVPAGHVMGLFLKGYHEPKRYRGSGLERGGKLIGQLERTLVLIFYLGNSLSGIAFLVVAKSILRFSDLQEGHQSANSSMCDTDGEKEKSGFAVSEYIILGSLLSYTVAILGGVSIDLMLGQMDVGTLRELLP